MGLTWAKTSTTFNLQIQCLAHPPTTVAQMSHRAQEELDRRKSVDVPPPTPGWWLRLRGLRNASRQHRVLAQEEDAMNGIIYLVGLVVIVLFILSALGLR